jgi:hypothetical protein
MKNLILTLAVLVSATTIANAQSAKYIAVMQKNVDVVDSFVKQDMAALASTFKRIGDAEKTQGLPYYYAALSKMFQTYTMPKRDPKVLGVLCNEIDSLIDKAIALGFNNSETKVLQGMVLTTRMDVEPSRFMEYGPGSTAKFKEAMALDSTNPRAVLQLAIGTFFTPEQFGGGKAKAEKLAAKAEALFATFKPASSIHPVWGRSTLYGFLMPMFAKKEN